MNALKTTTRPKPRKKQRTVSPQPSTSKQLNKRTLPADDESDHSNDIELIDPPPNPPPNTARPQRKEGKAKASESRPNGKVPENQSNTKPESQVKGKAPESRAKDNQVKPKPVKVVAKKHSSNPSIDNASDHDDDRDQEHKMPPLNPRIDKELERWKSKVKDLENQRDKLSQQLEELFQVRKTDAEQALDDLTALYENRSKTQESLISALQAQLASQSPFFRTSESEPNSSKSTHPPPNSTASAIPNFLTRATADAEQHMLQDELVRLKDDVKAKAALVKERERRIVELEQSVKDVRIELDAEIARSKELLSRQPPSHSHHSRADSDTKHAVAIRFYEDFSNLLILSIKFEQRGNVEDDILYTCMYTHIATMTDDETEAWEQVEKTITFSLRVCTDLSEEPELARRVKYTPLELDKLSDEFKERLGFLANGFSFPHNQATLFLGSLSRQMEAAFGEDKSGNVSVVDEYEEGAEIIEVDDL
ncbi:hypothetical protein AZE42_12920 [Rhizopogon vesiculosus]|uniref:Monopolin complex subunit Csm1/Pcs1 C-terminal domain-containing protein n=1 Tax=Rhizopogon vesiculosus TaxID=180088 RepID=A0A1J8Q2E1_9AGAM|nr:hypothetical protein AZE42_12920 [Rhizopogon vesiculosus]